MLKAPRSQRIGGRRRLKEGRRRCAALHRLLDDRQRRSSEGTEQRPGDRQGHGRRGGAQIRLGVGFVSFRLRLPDFGFFRPLPSRLRLLRPRPLRLRPSLLRLSRLQLSRPLPSPPPPAWHLLPLSIFPVRAGVPISADYKKTPVREDRIPALGCGRFRARSHAPQAH